MPLKPGRQAHDSLSQTSDAPASSSRNSAASRSTTHPSSSSGYKQSNSPFKRFIDYFGDRLSSSSRKRPRLDSHAQKDGKLLLTSDAITSASASPSSAAFLPDATATTPASEFIDLSPSKTTCSVAFSTKDTPLLVSSQEGAIRDPLGRTSLTPSPSTGSTSIFDTRSSSEEAAEMQIKHFSPRSSLNSPSTSDLTTFPTNAAATSNADIEVADQQAPPSGPEAEAAAKVETKAKELPNDLTAPEAEQSEVSEQELESKVAVAGLEMEPSVKSDVRAEEPAAGETTSFIDSQPGPLGTGEHHASRCAANAQESRAEHPSPADDFSGEGKMSNVKSQHEQAREEEHNADKNTVDALDIESEPKSTLNDLLDEPALEDKMSTTDSQLEQAADDVSDDAEHPLPTDADVDHIQMVANAKVGEQIEGLLDWSGSLSSEEHKPPSDLASEVSDDAATAPASQDDPSASHGAQVVDLVSDSEDSTSGHEDPDKENDVSLVHSTPRLDSDASLPTIAYPGLSQQFPRTPRSRHSLVGPMAQGVWRKQRMQAQGTSQPLFSPTVNDLEYADTSATEQIRSIGRQSRFFQPSRRNVPQSSTPQHTQPPPARARSFSFSSNVSATSNHGLGTVYRKKDSIFQRQHLREVRVYNEVSLQRSISIAMEQINQLRSSRRKPLFNAKQFKELADYTKRIHKLVAQDNPKDASRGHYLDQMEQKFMRQREVDAQTAILPLPKAKLLERERLAREEKAKLKKLRGVLGRKALPRQLSDEQDRAASVALSKRGRVADIQGASVDDKDVQKLRPGEWLNDEVINFYGTLILNRANDAERERTEAIAAAKNASSDLVKKSGNGKVPRPYDQSLDAFWRVHFFSSFFYNILRDKGYTGVKRWTRRVDIFAKDVVLFPINLGNAHWVCGAINMRKRRFEYYDSLGTPNNKAFELMRTYVSEEAQDKKKMKIDLRGWKNVFSDESPQQENGYDCGVFAAQTLEQISRRDPHSPIPLDGPAIQWMSESLDEGAEKLNIGGEEDDDDDEYEWNFAQENMPYLRRRMAYEIFSKHLLD